VIHLEDRVERALLSGDESDLDVLGYGEISTVLALDSSAGRFACKRLPVFRSEAAVEIYRQGFEQYLARLVRSGVDVVESHLVVFPRGPERLTVYCLQPGLDPGGFVVRLLRQADREQALALWDALLERMLGAVGPRLGLDGQASNWVQHEGRLLYLDVTTPLIRDAAGREVLDTELFLASLPWALRGLVRRFFLADILDKYYEPRGVIVDLIGNLIKEGLRRWIDPFLERANQQVTPAIGVPEVERYYASDARMWALLQRLRHLDRFWQRRVRRRPYAIVLPGRIDRHV
jgi:hypothetical protein